MSGDSLAGRGVRVASSVPGRIRLRTTDAAGRQALSSVAEALETSPEVIAVQVRPRSASVVVLFEPQHAAVVADALLGLGVDLRAAPAPVVGADPATAFMGALAAVDRGVGRRLGGIDLRTLVPLGLGLMAARRAMRGDERLADAPWYVLAWYASETLAKFHGGAPAARHIEGEVQ